MSASDAAGRARVGKCRATPRRRCRTSPADSSRGGGDRGDSPVRPGASAVVRLGGRRRAPAFASAGPAWSAWPAAGDRATLSTFGHEHRWGGQGEDHMRVPTLSILSFLAAAAAIVAPTAGRENPIVHDAEYYILEAQNGDRNGRPKIERLDGAPGGTEREARRRRRTLFISCGMIRPIGDVGIPAIQMVRGLTKRQILNQMARRRRPLHSHVHRSRLHAEPRRVHDRPASRFATRMYNIGMLREHAWPTRPAR